MKTIGYLVILALLYPFYLIALAVRFVSGPSCPYCGSRTQVDFHLRCDPNDYDFSCYRCGSNFNFGGRQ